jgi:hypothetical protein
VFALLYLCLSWVIACSALFEARNEVSLEAKGHVFQCLPRLWRTNIRKVYASTAVWSGDLMAQKGLSDQCNHLNFSIPYLMVNSVVYQVYFFFVLQLVDPSIIHLYPSSGDCKTSPIYITLHPFIGFHCFPVESLHFLLAKPPECPGKHHIVTWMRATMEGSYCAQGHQTVLSLLEEGKKRSRKATREGPEFVGFLSGKLSLLFTIIYSEFTIVCSYFTIIYSEFAIVYS